VPDKKPGCLAIMFGGQQFVARTLAEDSEIHIGKRISCQYGKNLAGFQGIEPVAGTDDRFGAQQAGCIFRAGHIGMGVFGVLIHGIQWVIFPPG